MRRLYFFRTHYIVGAASSKIDTQIIGTAGSNMDTSYDRGATSNEIDTKDVVGATGICFILRSAPGRRMTEAYSASC